LAIKQHSHVWESKKLNADKLEQNVSISIIIDKITITNFFQFLSLEIWQSHYLFYNLFWYCYEL